MERTEKDEPQKATTEQTYMQEQFVKWRDSDRWMNSFYWWCSIGFEDLTHFWYKIMIRTGYAKRLLMAVNTDT